MDPLLLTLAMSRSAKVGFFEIAEVGVVSHLIRSK